MSEMNGNPPEQESADSGSSFVTIDETSPPLEDAPVESGSTDVQAAKKKEPKMVTKDVWDKILALKKEKHELLHEKPYLTSEIQKYKSCTTDPMWWQDLESRLDVVNGKIERYSQLRQESFALLEERLGFKVDDTEQDTTQEECHEHESAKRNGDSYVPSRSSRLCNFFKGLFCHGPRKQTADIASTSNAEGEDSNTPFTGLTALPDDPFDEIVHYLPTAARLCLSATNRVMYDRMQKGGRSEFKTVTSNDFGAPLKTIETKHLHYPPEKISSRIGSRMFPQGFTGRQRGREEIIYGKQPFDQKKAQSFMNFLSAHKDSLQELDLPTQLLIHMDKGLRARFPALRISRLAVLVEAWEAFPVLADAVFPKVQQLTAIRIDGQSTILYEREERDAPAAVFESLEANCLNLQRLELTHFETGMMGPSELALLDLLRRRPISVVDFSYTYQSESFIRAILASPSVQASLEEFRFSDNFVSGPLYRLLVCPKLRIARPMGKDIM